MNWQTASSSVKLLERIIDQRLRTIVELGNMQFGLRRGISTGPCICIKDSTRKV